MPSYYNKNQRDTLGTFVPSEGPLDARVIILGESPWINEAVSQRPFAGASGNLLRRFWTELGLYRSQMRLMNLHQWRPPTREITSLPASSIIQAIEEIHEKIARLTDPYVIIPMGNYTTYALTGKGKVRADIRSHFGGSVGTTEAEKKAGISQLRGSIYPYRDLNGRTIKVIPMIHPAAVLQMPKWEKRSLADWRKVRREQGFKEIRQPQRQHIINPSKVQIEEFCQEVYRGGMSLRMSVDIETWGNYLSCVGFALTNDRSITIPTHGADEDNLPWVKWLCESEAQKVLQNGQYDTYWLDAYDIGMRNYFWDTMNMHHAIDPAESHSLDFLASVYCEHYVYWKDEAKEAEEIVKYARDLDALYVYNGLDVCYTRELVDVLEGELKREGMLEFYFQHYQQMFEPLVKTMRHGFRVDVSKQKAYAKRLRGELKELHLQLNALAGEELFATEERTALREPTEEEWEELFIGDYWEDWKRPQYGATAGTTNQLIEVPPAKFINREARDALKERGLTYMIGGANAGKIRYKVTKIKKDFSTEKLIHFFYTTLGLPEQKKNRKRKGGRKVSTIALDEDAIRKLMGKYPKAVQAGGLLLQYRGKKKEYDYVKGSWDADGRMRCTYKMTTNAGRLASSKNPMRKGMNLQNLKR